jgi:NAD(P)-dependent dehydrogenase (short-subunit alcohol dehydrogenase family)
MQLEGKVAFVTGGGGGIGLGIAQAFVENGMKVVVADINPAYLEEAAAELGAAAMPLVLDVTRLESWAGARQVAIARFGRVDVLCNNAGVATERMPLDQLPPKEFARVMEINVTGVYNGVATFAPGMREQRSGHIVNTSSMNGLIPYGTFAAYCASKYAVLGMSEAIRQELAPSGIGVSILFPGLTRSRMSTDPKVGAIADLDEETRRRLAQAQMMEPIWLGRAVARAIEANEPYIVTHPGSKPMIDKRFEAILAAFGEPAEPGFKEGF